jgi:hypothetical protein
MLMMFYWFMSALGVWRVTHLLALEDGPANLVVRLRTILGESFWGTLMDCFYCLSLWVAAPAALLLTRSPCEWPLAWLSLSGAACLLEQFSGKGSAHSSGEA